jgi:hypothetical protein
MAKVEYGGLILATNCHISPRSPNANDAKLSTNESPAVFLLPQELFGVLETPWIYQWKYLEFLNS